MKTGHEKPGKLDKTAVVIAAVIVLIGIIFGIYWGNQGSVGPGVSDSSYTSVETSLERAIPGITDGEFHKQVDSYCSSERSVDYTQNTFRRDGKPLSYQEAGVVKRTIDSANACS